MIMKAVTFKMGSPKRMIILVLWYNIPFLKLGHLLGKHLTKSVDDTIAARTCHSSLLPQTWDGAIMPRTIRVVLQSCRYIHRLKAPLPHNNLAFAQHDACC